MLVLRKMRNIPLLDALLLALVLLIAAVPLIIFRQMPSNLTNPLSTSLNGQLLTAIGLAECIVILMFCRRGRKSSLAQPVQTFAQNNGNRPVKTGAVFNKLLVCLLLLGITLVAFYIPMRRYFWTGNDEIYILSSSTKFWSQEADNQFSRPLVYFVGNVWRIIGGENIAVFLALITLVVYTTTILVYRVVCLVLPNSSNIALIAALLFIVSPIEPTRFYVVWMNAYIFNQFLLMFTAFLFIKSYLHQIRWLLVLSFLLLALGILIAEAIMPIALLVPLLLVSVWRKRRDLPATALWSLAWFGIIALLLCRLIVHFATAPAGANYQAQMLSSTHGIRTYLSNLIPGIAATLNYIRPYPGWNSYVGYGLFVAGLAFVVLLLSLRKKEPTPDQKLITAGLAITLLATLLAISPFFFISVVWRTEFLALPAQAIGWAFVIGIIALQLPRRLYYPTLLVVPSLLTGMAMTNVIAQNEHAVYSVMPLYPKIQFGKTYDLVQQVHRIAPGFQPGTTIVFYLDKRQPSNPADSPFGVGYYLHGLGAMVFGTSDTYQVNNFDFIGWQTKFTSEGFTCVLPSGKGGSTQSGCGTVGIDGFTPVAVSSDGPAATGVYPYDTLVVFRVSVDGVVTLLDKLSPNLLPPGVSALAYKDYNPIARIAKDSQSPMYIFK